MFALKAEINGNDVKWDLSISVDLNGNSYKITDLNISEQYFLNIKHNLITRNGVLEVFIKETSKLIS